MKRVVIHIGSFKTGTSSIQNFLWDHRDEMDGINYVDAGLLKTEKYIGVRHYHLWRKLHEESLWEDLRNEICRSKKDVHVISYEGLSRCSDDEVELIRGRLSDFDVEVIFYVRRQDFFAQSFYLEYVKNHAYFGSFSYFIKSPFVERLLDYNAIANRWALAFGRESVRVVGYEMAIAKYGDIVKGFFDAVGLLSEKVNSFIDGYESVHNPSLGVRDLPYIMSFNASSFSGEDSLPFQRKVVRDFCELLDFKKDNANDRAFCFCRKEAENFMKRFHVSNSVLSENFNSGNPFFEEGNGWPVESCDIGPDSRMVELFDSIKRNYSR